MELKASELRIGNWLRSKEDINHVFPVAVIDEGSYDYSYFEGIPLTDEIVAKYDIDPGSFRVTRHDSKSALWWFQMGFNKAGHPEPWCIITDLGYEHQLQNIYFVITGQEIPVKEGEPA